MTSPETIKEVERIQRKLKQKVKPKGDQPSYDRLKSGEKDPVYPYLVIVDDLKHFGSEARITESMYQNIKNQYDIRMKRWVGDLFECGLKNYYISGPRRYLVKEIAFKDAETKTEIPDTHFHIAGREIHPYNIIAAAHDRQLNVLWVDVFHQQV